MFEYFLNMGTFSTPSYLNSLLCYGVVSGCVCMFLHILINVACMWLTFCRHAQRPCGLCVCVYNLFVRNSLGTIE